MNVFLVLFHSIWIQYIVCFFPEDQPGCLFRPAMPLFYAYHSNIDDSSKNWFCDETFEEKLKICIDVFQKTTQGQLESTYKIIKNKETVIRECKKRKMIFTQIEGEDSQNTDSVVNVTIHVKMFQCPINQMELQFPVEWAKPPEIFDMYLALGRNDVTLTALRDSLYINNICVRDTYLYPPPHLRETNRSRPFYPEELVRYKINSAELRKVSDRMILRKMATQKMTVPTTTTTLTEKTVMVTFPKTSRKKIVVTSSRKTTHKRTTKKKTTKK